MLLRTLEQVVNIFRPGLAPTLPNDSNQYLNGSGNWTTPSGTGGSYLYFSSVALNHSQISNLNSTPIDVVPAPGAGFVAIPLRFTFTKDFSAGAYTNNPTLFMRYPGLGNDLMNALSGVLNNNGVTLTNVLANVWTFNTSSLENLPLRFSTSVNPTGGNAANTAIVGIHYNIVAVL